MQAFLGEVGEGDFVGGEDVGVDPVAEFWGETEKRGGVLVREGAGGGRRSAVVRRGSFANVHFVLLHLTG